MKIQMLCLVLIASVAMTLSLADVILADPQSPDRTAQATAGSEKIYSIISTTLEKLQSEGVTAGNAGGYTGSYGSGQRHHDPEYHQWREEQIRNLDNDYQSWREERYKKFSDDFTSWRNSRSGGQGQNEVSASRTPRPRPGQRQRRSSATAAPAPSGSTSSALGERPGGQQPHRRHVVGATNPTRQQ